MHNTSINDSNIGSNNTLPYIFLFFLRKLLTKKNYTEFKTFFLSTVCDFIY